MKTLVFLLLIVFASPFWQNGRSVMDMAKEKENQEIISLLNRQKAVSNPNVSHVRKVLV